MSNPRYISNEEIEELLNASDGIDDFSSSSDEEYEPESEIPDPEDDLYSLDSDIEENDTSSPINEREYANETIDPMFVSKDGIVWQPEPIQQRSGRFRNENIISLPPGTTRYAKVRVGDIKDAFLLFFPQHIENVILSHYNAFARAKYGENFTKIDSNLLQAYIGLLILAGVYRQVINCIYFQ